jgi:hypothetical protein
MQHFDKVPEKFVEDLRPPQQQQQQVKPNLKFFK